LIFRPASGNAQFMRPVIVNRLPVPALESYVKAVLTAKGLLITSLAWR